MVNYIVRHGDKGHLLISSDLYSSGRSKELEEINGPNNVISDDVK